MNKISIIIPCLNEAENIAQTLHPLQPLRQRGHEIILCDGGSTDSSLQNSLQLVDHTIHSPPGRARQMNAGAKLATGDTLLFLHADTLAPFDIDKIILDSLQFSEKKWGHFNIKLNSPQLVFRIIETLINIRSSISGISTGDQGLFIEHRLFKKLNGYTDIPLMEDIELSKRLRKTSAPLCIKHTSLLTSSRRWKKHGVVKTVLLMWQLRLRYFLGTPAEQLAKAYQTHSPND